jgi:HlyD family secretion protein
MRSWRALARVPLGHALVAFGLTAAGCQADDPELRLVGTVERTQVELVAPVSETLVAVHAERGERVAAGQRLVELDPTYARVEVARAEAALAAARSGELVASQERERARRLSRGHALSQQDLDRATLALDEARARVREAEAQLAAGHKREADLTLSAPVPGVLDQLPFDAGERVPAGAVLAIVLADAAPWVRVWIPEESHVRVSPGTPAEVRIDGIARPLQGSVLDVSRDPEFTPHYALTERDRVYLVYETRVRILDAPPNLRPGVPAEVHILAPAHVATAEP